MAEKKDKKFDIPPGISQEAVERSIETAVARHLDGMSLVDLKTCQEELRATRMALVDMQQNFDVWRKLAELRGDQSEQRGAQIDDLQREVLELRTEIALLRSALDNRNEQQQ